jgi:protein arginine kinase activator
MKCESCHIKEATVQVKQVADGIVREVFLCSECAKISGLQSPAAIADFLFGADQPMPVTNKSKHNNKRCPVCHLTQDDFNKTSRLGCENCYEAFADELIPMIDELHRSVKHIGKVPERISSRSQIAILKEKLLEAVHRQAFEEAAEFRDMIKALEPA